MFVNYLIGLSGSLLWGSINALQIISSTALFDVVIPQDCVLTFQFLKNMTKFDLFYEIYDPNTLVGYTDTQPFNDRFESLGYESVGFFDLVGSVMVFVIYLISMQIARPLIMFLVRTLHFDESKVFKRIEKTGFFE